MNCEKENKNNIKTDVMKWRDGESVGLTITFEVTNNHDKEFLEKQFDKFADNLITGQRYEL